MTAAKPLAGLDRARYPRTAAYLDQLPEGLESFPECRAKASVPRTVYSFAEHEPSGLPPALQAELDAPSPTSSWIAQCQVLALILALVEAQGLAGEDEGRWIRGAAGRLFSSPMYKLLMWAATPRLMFKGANIRWSAFFRGSELRPTVGDHEATLELVAPAGLFDPALAKVFTDVLRSAVDYTEDGSSSTGVELEDFSPGCVRYHCSW